jgi:hypothetical protein
VKPEAKTLTRAILESFWPKEGWRSVAKGKECYSALCKALRERWHSVNIETGAPGSKSSKKCQKSKNCSPVSSIKLSAMG